MPVFKVWYKKRVHGPQGPVEIGLGGTHDIDCVPAQVARERQALFLSYKLEVERLLALELQSPLAAGSFEPSRAPKQALQEFQSSPETSSQHERTDSTRARPSEHPRERETPTDPEVVSPERAAQFMQELQLRLASRARAQNLSSESPSSPAMPGHPSLRRLGKLLQQDPQRIDQASAGDEELPEALARLMLKQEES